MVNESKMIFPAMYIPCWVFKSLLEFVQVDPPCAEMQKKGENLTPIKLSSIGVNILGCISIQGCSYDQWLEGLTLGWGGTNICQIEGGRKIGGQTL